ncbi:MAG: hypothetical protein B6244_06080 [Candidatus Cloacimonetes bacterium 4572_55]|nr:MAG: hypothetical protein B6244_06080 [Candidatus Cloacimonetes bacterium 4572_55]
MKNNMKMKYIVIMILFALNNAASSQEILNRYLEISTENNPELKAKFNEYLASLQAIPQVGALPDPQIAFGYFTQPVETRMGPQQFKISLSQALPWFGTIGAKKNVEIHHAKATYALFEETRSRLFLDIKSTYFDLYFIKKEINITNSNIRISTTSKNLALIEIRSGATSGVNALRAEMELADLENNLALLNDMWNVHILKFNNLLHVSEGSIVEIPDTLWTTNLQYSRAAALDSIKSNNHQISDLSHRRNAFHAKEALAKKLGKPRFSIGMDYIGIGKSDDNSGGQDAVLFPKVGITIPLYRKKYTAMADEAVYMQRAIDDRRMDKINELEMIFEKSYSEYVDADRRIALYQKQSRLAEEMIKILEAEYANDGKNFEEILRMEKQILTYSLELESALCDKQTSIAFIMYLMGE